MLRVNGRAYDWGDVDFQIPGLNIQVQEISYNDELEKEAVYGAAKGPGATARATTSRRARSASSVMTMTSCLTIASGGI